MTDIGYTLSTEEFGPNELVSQAKRAEAAGFDFLSSSDHYHPWVSAQGEAPFVWSVLGDVAEATDEIDVGIGVNCPIIRIHPAVVAHAAATAGAMLDGRFFFGVGTGERLNEHVTGEHWPPHRVRLEMLDEAITVIRKLWEGGQTSHYGEHYTVENARLFTLPDELPPIVVSAFGERAASAAGDLGDGFWSVGPRGNLVDRYESAGGSGPTYCQLHACHADSEQEAVETVHEVWPNSGLPGELGSQLPTPAHFEQATQMVSKEDIREGSIVTAPDPDEHIDSIQQAIDAGYDHVYTHQIGDDQQALIDLYEEEILPSFE